MALDTLSLVRDTSPAAEHFSQQYLRDLARSASSATGQVCSFEGSHLGNGSNASPPPPCTVCTEMLENLPCNWSLWDPEDWPDTIDEANWEKFIGGGGGEDRYADKCLYNITSIFNLHGQESSFERRYVYIYIYIVRCRRVNQ